MFRTSMTTVALLGLTGLGAASCTNSNNSCCSPDSTMSASTQPAANAVDLHNAICPVSGDKVGDSKLTEVYNGKIYHFCCDDCPKDFKKDPKKYEAAVAADPAKYGVKGS